MHKRHAGMAAAMAAFALSCAGARAQDNPVAALNVGDAAQYAFISTTKTGDQEVKMVGSLVYRVAGKTDRAMTFNVETVVLAEGADEETAVETVTPVVIALDRPFTPHTLADLLAVHDADTKVDNREADDPQAQTFDVPGLELEDIEGVMYETRARVAKGERAFAEVVKFEGAEEVPGFGVGTFEITHTGDGLTIHTEATLIAFLNAAAEAAGEEGEEGDGAAEEADGADVGE